MAGDIIVMDNCAIHHYNGGFALGHWLDQMGIDVVYLPTYSPELAPLVSINLHAAIYTALEEITANDMMGFYSITEYISV
jgi:hypothetical protein